MILFPLALLVLGAFVFGIWKLLEWAFGKIDERVNKAQSNLDKAHGNNEREKDRSG